MPQQLTNLKVNEISLVDRPANASTEPGTGQKNPHARVALWKADHGVKYLISGKDTGDHLPYTGPDGKPDHRLMGGAWAALHGGYRGNKYEGAGKDAAIARLKNIYEQEGMDTPDSTSKGDHMTLEQIEEKVLKQDGAIASLTAENAVLKDQLKMSAKEKKAFGGFSQKQKEDYMAADAEKRKAMMDDACKDDDDKADEDDDKEKRKKADTEAIVKAAAAVSDARVAKAEERLAKVEAENAEIRKRERLAKFTGIAKSELSHTSGADAAKGEVLMKMADTLGEDSDAYKQFFATQKAADKALAEYQYREVGNFGGGTDNSAHGQLIAKAEDIAKRDKINKQAAYGKAMIENPELYQQLQREQRVQ